MEKKSIWPTLRRTSGKQSKDEIKEKKHRSEDPFEEDSEPSRKTWPNEGRMIDPIRRVTPTAQPRQRVSHDDALNLQQRPSPQGPRQRPGEESNGQRAPYEPKYFQRSDSVPSLNGSSPLKATHFPQGARSMSQSTSREDNSKESTYNNGKIATAAKSFEYPPRTDSRAASSRTEHALRGAEASGDAPDNKTLRKYASREAVYNARSESNPVKTTKLAGLGLERMKSFEEDMHRNRHAPDGGTKQAAGRSKMNQEISAEKLNNDAGRAADDSTGIARWGTYSGQDSPKPPKTPGRSVSNGEEMQQWLKQNSASLKKYGSPERPRGRGRYDYVSPRLKNDAEAFRRFKEASHRRKVSIEAIRKAQMGMIVYPQKLKYDENSKAGSSHRRAGSVSKKQNSYGTIRKASVRNAVHPVSPLKRLPQVPELMYPPEELPSPFLRPGEKGKTEGAKPSIHRKPVTDDTQERYHEGDYQSEQSPDSSLKSTTDRSKIRTPGKAIRRKTLKGPSASDLARQRALEYERLASGNPFDARSDSSTPKLGLPRSYPEQNIAIRAIATPTYDEVNSEPFRYPELVPKPLNIKKKPTKQTSTIRAVLQRKPPLISSKTEVPTSSASSRGYWNYGQRTRSDDFENWKQRQNQDKTIKQMHDNIDDYLDTLLKSRIEDKLAEAEIERHRERVSSRTMTAKPQSVYEESEGEDKKLHRASLVAEGRRWQELNVEKAQNESQSSPEASKEAPQDATWVDMSDDDAASEETTPKVVDKWAEMRAKLRVESTYSNLNDLSRSPM